MATTLVPTPPPGFELEQGSMPPAPPPGFELEGQVAPPPPGFELEPPSDLLGGANASISAATPGGWSTSLKGKILQTISKVFPSSPEQDAAKLQNILAISKQSKVPVTEVYKHLDSMARDPKITGIMPDNLTNEEFATLATIPFIGAAVIQAPLTAGLGLLGYTALNKVINLNDFVPPDAPDTVKTAASFLDFGMKSAVLGGAFKIAENKMPPFIEKYFQTKLTEINPASVFKMTRDQVADIFKTGTLVTKEQMDIFKGLGLTREQLLQAVRQGLDIEIPGEKIVKMVDKPGWAAFKKVLGVKPLAEMFPKDPLLQAISKNKVTSEVIPVAGKPPAAEPPAPPTLALPANIPPPPAGFVVEKPTAAPIPDEAKIKSAVEDFGAKLKSITTPENSLYEDEPTVYIDVMMPDGLPATLTARPSQLTSPGKLIEKVLSSNKEAAAVLVKNIVEKGGGKLGNNGGLITDPNLLMFGQVQFDGPKVDTHYIPLPEFTSEAVKASIEEFKGKMPRKDALGREIVSNRPAKEQPVFTPEDLKRFEDISDKSAHWQGGGELIFGPEIPGEPRKVVGTTPSTFPQELKNIGMEQKRIQPTLKNIKEGKPLTPKQKEVAETLLKWHKEVVDATSGLSESETAEVIREVNKAAPLSEADKTWGDEEPPTAPTVSGESGKIDVSLLPLVNEAIEIAGHLKEASDELGQTIAPGLVSSEAKLSAAMAREGLGKKAQAWDRLEAATAELHKSFEKLPNDFNVEFIDRMEHGTPQPDAALQTAATLLNDPLVMRREKIRSLGTGALEEFNRNYFPRYWAEYEKTMKAGIGKKPLEGPKSFLKERTYATLKEGIAAGLTPLSYNPVDFVLWKCREMDRYIFARELLQSGKDEGFVEAVMIGKEKPEGWVKINDNISVIYKNPQIPIKEAFDSKVMESLNKVATALGIEHLRKVNIGGKRWGYATRSGKKVVTKFAGDPTMVLAHEIGHAIDFKYGLQEIMFGGSRPYADFIIDKMIGKANREGRLDDVKRLEEQKVRNKELRDLADERQQRQAYARKGEEKMAVMMEAYIHAPELFKRVAPNTFKFFENFLKSHDELKPFLEIKPSVVLEEGKASVYAGGLVIAGHYYAQPDFARVVNNYLSPGLEGSKLYQVYRAAGNLLNQSQLGLSAFHAGFTSFDVMTSRLALGLYKIFAGYPIEGLGTIASTPAALLTNVYKGHLLHAAWYGKASTPEMKMIAEFAAIAGGRAKMDARYSTHIAKRIADTFREGKLVKGVLQLPIAGIEIAAYPIMQWLVPRQKFGVFFDLMKFEIEKNPDMTHAELRTIAQEIWNSVDNRLGQMVYDNIFWNKVFKDALMGSVRSTGWDVGTINELGGGAYDGGKLLLDMVRRKKTKFTYRLSYLIALPILVGIVSAMYQYLATGKSPESRKDLFFPQTGGVDKNGNPNRVSLPSYMKDVYHFRHSPWRTILNKVAPLPSLIAQQLENKDFYGTEIIHADDPLIKKIGEELKFLGTQLTPFGIRNYQKESYGQSKVTKALSFVGIVPAPYDVNMTEAEKKASEIQRKKHPSAARTQEQAAESQAITKVRNEYSMTKDKKTLLQAIKDGVISRAQASNIMKSSRKIPIEKMVSSFTVEQTVDVFKDASPEEKIKIKKILLKKIANKMKYPERLPPAEIKYLKKVRQDLLNPQPEEPKPWVDLSVFSNLREGSIQNAPNADFTNLNGTQPKKRFSIVK
jgi:hypothetical protein